MRPQITTPRPTPDALRRTAAIGVASLLGILPALAVLSFPALRAPEAAPCPDGAVLVVPGAPDACVHADAPPRGVDVRKPVSTRSLKARPGAGRRALEAAETLGTASPAPTSDSLAAVPCDGDGVSGNRVQAMYVVEEDRPNRFSALRGSFKAWAAGVDDVVNRSAAVTGGVRNVRYVTESGAGGICEAKVLDVTVPDGALDSFSATVSALRALGYDRRDRKYLIWSDATVLCGVASLYDDDRDVVDNQNNGSYAQYARVDTGCWGLGDAAGQHSTEAHELGHMLGGVQDSAPHSTKAGHCTDEQDTLCYADSSSVTTVEVCAPAAEYLLDCKGDDYFNTLPEQGSYLDTHWNAADSSFLINGGSVDPTATFGGDVGVNSPVVAGLPTQVSVTPHLVDGRTLRKVEWSVDREDCSLVDPASPQTKLVCQADADGVGQAQALLVDSTGATTTATAEFTLDDASGRQTSVRIAVDDADPEPGEVCRAQEVPVTARVVDLATGQPVAGLSVTVDRKASGSTPESMSGTTGLDGRAVVTDVVQETVAYAARTEAVGSFTAAQSEELNVVPVDCVLPTTSTLTGSVDRTQVGYGEDITVTGRLTAATGEDVRPVAQGKVTVTVTSGTSSVTLGAAETGTDGRYTATVPLTVAGTVTVSYAGSGDVPPASHEAGWVDYRTWNTVLGISASKRGKTYTATGTLHRSIGEGWLVAPGRTVDVWYTPAGTTQRQLLGTGVTAADGSYLVSFPVKAVGTGTLVATMQPATGYVTAISGALTVGRKR